VPASRPDFPLLPQAPAPPKLRWRAYGNKTATFKGLSNEDRATTDGKLPEQETLRLLQNLSPSSIAARVVAIAEPGETLMSSTVRDLVAGSGLRFDDRGFHALRGLPKEVRLYSALAAG
jgi:hypothetical protein